MSPFLQVGLVGVLGCVLAAAAAEVKPQVKPEEAVDYRQSVYTVIRWNFKPIGDMVKGEVPYDAVAVARHAAFLETLSQMPMEGFVPDSRVGDTEAKPEVWEDREDFEVHMEQFQEEAARLADVAEHGDREAVKEQFGKTAKACKNCHDKFREKK